MENDIDSLALLVEEMKPKKVYGTLTKDKLNTDAIEKGKDKPLKQEVKKKDEDNEDVYSKYMPSDKKDEDNEDYSKSMEDEHSSAGYEADKADDSADDSELGWKVNGETAADVLKHNLLHSGAGVIASINASPDDFDITFKDPAVAKTFYEFARHVLKDDVEHKRANTICIYRGGNSAPSDDPKW